ncbi:MAG: transcriptional regulator [Cyanobacteria bacterium P01_C01_bin.69]
MSKFIVSDDVASSNDYGKLLQRVQPKRITTEKDYSKFVTLLENLLEKEEDKQLSPQEDLLVELLVVLVQEYESQNVSFPKSTPLDILQHLMESNGLKQSSLVGIVGSSGVVSEIMNGKREISKQQARSLGERFNVSYKLFL